ncbi:MAG TPA: hypothetical protein VND68_03180, partial [Chloroflexia bacterium]|nr:hypothetical protein [Chloroflexia bacterium]
MAAGGPSRKGIIYTFYSYKGGVGRSMALANVAELLYQLGLRVVMIDWDLEAPGLERYFPLDMDKVLRQPGLMNLLLKYKERMSMALPEGEQIFEKPDSYLINIYPETNSVGRLWLLTAGQRQGEIDFAAYSRQVREFDWKDFYANWEGEIYFEWLRSQLEGAVDVVLIDSRTGVTEMGGASTYQFADVAVLFCGASTQSLDGLLHVAQGFKRPLVEEVRGGRPLRMLMVPARVEDRAETALLNSFRDRFVDSFESYLSSQISDDPTFLWKLKIPYVPLNAFTEMVAVREHGQMRAEDLVQAYANLTLAMAHLTPEDKTSYVSLAEAIKLLPQVARDGYPLLVPAQQAAASPGSDGGTQSDGAEGSVAAPLLPLDIGVSAPPFRPPPPPYPGMLPYQRKDAPHFYGRAAEVRRMVQHLRNSAFLLLVGPSSSGKSSLLAAGLVPAALTSAYWAAGYWAVLEMRPGSRPVRTLFDLLDYGPGGPGSLADAARAWLAARTPAQRILLVVDQLEEMFLQAGPEEQAQFIGVLAGLRASGTCVVVTALRSDSYQDLRASALWPVNPKDMLELAPLQGDDLREAIRQPALDVGVKIEPDLVERLVADAAEEPGRMPLVQETLLVLWESMKHRRISLSAYEQLGQPGVTGLAVAVARRADSVMEDLTPEQRKIARRIFIRLVQF